MEKTALVLFLVAVELYHITDALVSISTPNQVSYRPLEPDGISVQSVKSIRFLIEATNDVHVGLYPGSSYSPVPNPLYEIVIGGWGNGKSVIRKRQQGSILAHKDHTPLSPTGFRAFWVSWDNGVRVGTGTVVGENQFMFLDDSTYDVKYVAIFTAYGSTGYWRFVDYSLLSSSSISITLDTSSDSATADRLSSSFEDLVTSESASASFLVTQTDVSLPDSHEQTSIYMQDLRSSVGGTATHFVEQTATYMEDLESSAGDTGFDSTYFESLSTSALATRVISDLSASTQQVLNTENTNSATGFYTTDHIPESVSQNYNINTKVSSEIISSTVLDDSVLSSIAPSTSLADVEVTKGLSTVSEFAALVSTSTSTSTQSPQRRLCSCRCLFKNITPSQMRKLFEKTVRGLLVSKTNLSSRRRKLSSAHDERPSSQGIGSGMIFLAVLPIVLVLLSDIQKLFVIIFRKK